MINSNICACLLLVRISDVQIQHNQNSILCPVLLWQLHFSMQFQVQRSYVGVHVLLNPERNFGGIEKYLQNPLSLKQFQL